MFCLCLQVRREPRAPLEIQVKASKGLTGPRASEVPHFLSGSSVLKGQCALTTAQDEFLAANISKILPNSSGTAPPAGLA